MKMQIRNQIPKLCISVAEKPGKFGFTVHNAGFKALGLNFVYIPFATQNLKGVIDGIRALNIRGCSVTMPFKEEVIPLLDELDSLAYSTKAVNTIVNNEGHLVGYNTDVVGIKKCIKSKKIKKNKKILVLGSGGIAKAIFVALSELNFKNITVCNRTSNTARRLAKHYNMDFIKWSDREKSKMDVVINATSIGMYHNDVMLPLSESFLRTSEIIMDVVASPVNTRLIKFANKNKIISINGFELAFHQACEQFKLYTNKKPPVKSMKNAALQLMRNK
jgi:shikimate dehydrogenase